MLKKLLLSLLLVNSFILAENIADKPVTSTTITQKLKTAALSPKTKAIYIMALPMDYLYIKQF